MEETEEAEAAAAAAAQSVHVVALAEPCVAIHPAAALGAAPVDGVPVHAGMGIETEAVMHGKRSNGEQLLAVHFVIKSSVKSEPLCKLLSVLHKQLRHAACSEHMSKRYL